MCRQYILVDGQSGCTKCTLVDGYVCMWVCKVHAYMYVSQLVILSLKIKGNDWSTYATY